MFPALILLIRMKKWNSIRRLSTLSGNFFSQVGKVETELFKLRVCMKMDQKEIDYKILLAKALEGDVWKQQQTLSDLNKDIEDINLLKNTVDEAKGLFELAHAEQDQEMKSQCAVSLDIIEEVIRKKRMQVLLSGPFDSSSCYMQIVAGAGGIESRDWVSMLGRMYLAWAEQQDHNEINNDIKAMIVDTDNDSSSSCSSTTTDSPRSLTIKFTGAGGSSFPYGFLKSEAGVHR